MMISERNLLFRDTHSVVNWCLPQRERPAGPYEKTGCDRLELLASLFCSKTEDVFVGWSFPLAGGFWGWLKILDYPLPQKMDESILEMIRSVGSNRYLPLEPSKLVMFLPWLHMGSFHLPAAIFHQDKKKTLIISSPSLDVTGYLMDTKKSPPLVFEAGTCRDSKDFSIFMLAFPSHFEAWGPGGHERLNDVAQRLLHGMGYLVVDGCHAWVRFQ